MTQSSADDKPRHKVLQELVLEKQAYLLDVVWLPIELRIKGTRACKSVRVGFNLELLEIERACRQSIRNIFHSPLEMCQTRGNFKPLIAAPAICSSHQAPVADIEGLGSDECNGQNLLSTIVLLQHLSQSRPRSSQCPEYYQAC